MTLPVRMVFSLCLISSVSLSPAWAPPAKAQHGHQHDPLPNVTEYLDRLDRPERDQDQKPSQVIEALRLKPGMSVADLGSGSGYFTRRFVDAVTDQGTVYAIDVEAKALQHIEQRLQRLNRPYHVELILAPSDNPMLPPSSVDLIFICNTYHHLENHRTYLRHLRSALKPGGRVAIIDFYPDERSGDLGFPKVHLATPARVVEEMSTAGFEPTIEHAFLPKQYFLEFTPR